MKINRIFFAFLVIVPQLMLAQKSIQPREPEPKPGDRMPEFTLTDVHHFKKSQVSLADFRGQWLILDFWYRGCGACIRSFPKIDKLQAAFKGRIQFLMVGDNSSESFGKGLDGLYERLRRKQHLDLAVAFDSTLCDRWGIWAFPRVVIVDPAGIVQYVTTGFDMTAEKLQDVLDGKKVGFMLSDDLSPFQPGKISASITLVKYRSVLSEWSGERQSISPIDFFIADSATATYNVARVNLGRLYELAFFGRIAQTAPSDSLYLKVYPRPLLEMKDTSDFVFDFYKQIGIYNYELTVPKFRKTKKNLMMTMQRDLNFVFGYDAAVEHRLMPVWKLVAMPGAAAKLKAKGGAFQSSPEILGDGGVAGFSVWNCPIFNFLNAIVLHSEFDLTPYVNETGIQGKIDITIDALMTDRSQVIRELRKNGLDLVKGTRVIKVLVIRDANRGIK